jgi:hypothetical protein
MLVEAALKKAKANEPDLAGIVQAMAARRSSAIVLTALKKGHVSEARPLNVIAEAYTNARGDGLRARKRMHRLHAHSPRQPTPSQVKST